MSAQAGSKKRGSSEPGRSPLPEDCRKRPTDCGSRRRRLSGVAEQRGAGHPLGPSGRPAGAESKSEVGPAGLAPPPRLYPAPVPHPPTPARGESRHSLRFTGGRRGWWAADPAWLLVLVGEAGSTSPFRLVEGSIGNFLEVAKYQGVLFCFICKQRLKKAHFFPR